MVCIGLDVPSAKTAQVRDKKVSKRAATDDIVAHFAPLSYRNSYSFTVEAGPTVGLNNQFFCLFVTLSIA